MRFSEPHHTAVFPMAVRELYNLRVTVSMGSASLQQDEQQEIRAMTRRACILIALCFAFLGGVVFAENYQQITEIDWGMFPRPQRAVIRKISADLDYLKARTDVPSDSLLLQMINESPAGSSPVSISLSQYPKPIMATIVAQAPEGQFTTSILLVAGQIASLSFACPPPESDDGGLFMSVKDKSLIIKTGCRHPVQTAVNVLYSR